MFSDLEAELTIFITPNETEEKIRTFGLQNNVIVVFFTVSIPRAVSGFNGSYFPTICRLCLVFLNAAVSLSKVFI